MDINCTAMYMLCMAMDSSAIVNYCNQRKRVVASALPLGRGMRIRLVVLLAALLTLGGCSLWDAPRSRHFRSSLVDYLYPHRTRANASPARLRLPLRVR